MFCDFKNFILSLFLKGILRAKVEGIMESFSISLSPLPLPLSFLSLLPPPFLRNLFFYYPFFLFFSLSSLFFYLFYLIFIFSCSLKLGKKKDFSRLYFLTSCCFLLKLVVKMRDWRWFCRRFWGFFFLFLHARKKERKKRRNDGQWKKTNVSCW